VTEASVTVSGLHRAVLDSAVGETQTHHLSITSPTLIFSHTIREPEK